MYIYILFGYLQKLNVERFIMINQKPLNVNDLRCNSTILCSTQHMNGHHITVTHKINNFLNNSQIENVLIIFLFECKNKNYLVYL